MNDEERTLPSKPVKRKRSDASDGDRPPLDRAHSDKASAGIVVKDKKQRACINCRRSKLKCVPGPDGTTCVRCATRKEECRFKTRAHDDEWQESTNNRLDTLTHSVEQLTASVNTILRHLNLPRDHTKSTSESSPMGQSSATPWLTPSASSLDGMHPSSPTPIPLDHSTTHGAEALLAQTEMSDEYFSMNHISTPPGGLFNILDDLINTTPSVPGSSPQLKLSETLGASDPRPNIIKNGVVNLSDANVLVDHFHAHLAQYLFGFPLQIGAWPYLPEGKPTMTPLILGVACLIPAERLPHYHHLFNALSAELSETIFNASPGYSSSHRPVSTENPDAEAASLDAPDLDLELGIGPEEITALCAAATFTCSERSDAMARTVFEWTRGYLKTFKNPPPHPLTLGEVCGLLPPRRNLTFENWLRLWLFAYIVYAQQALHRNRRAPVFDPRPFCSLLFDNLSTIPPSEQARDLQLIGHARLCAIFQRVQHAQGAQSWRFATPDSIITAFDGWNSEVSQWKAELDRFELPTHAKMLLTSFGLFARVYINQGGLEDPALADSPRRWVYGTAAAQAAHDMLEIAQLEPFASGLPFFPPIYIQMVTLSAAVLLKSLRHSVHIVMPTFHQRICEMVERTADVLTTDAVPPSHISRSASLGLRQAVARVKGAGMPS